MIVTIKEFWAPIGGIKQINVYKLYKEIREIRLIRSVRFQKHAKIFPHNQNRKLLYAKTT